MTTSKTSRKTASRRKAVQADTPAEQPTAHDPEAIARAMDAALDAAVTVEAPTVPQPPEPEPEPEPRSEPAPTTTGETAVQVMNDTIARLDGDLTQMEALLASLTGEQDATEAAHAQHAASSPLALRLELVGCQWASEVFPQGQHASNIPQYVWGELRCPFGKERPDQDCRDCVHHKITPLGASEAVYTRRYPRYGAVVALTDDDATALAHYLKALGRPALRRVASERGAVEQAIQRARDARSAEVRREIERQQGGR